MADAFKYPQTAAAFQRTYHWFYNDLKFVRNTDLESLVMQGIKDAVMLGEQKFDQPFGGWTPKSTEFGIAPLRPHVLGKPSSKWSWTSGSSSSVNWSASDTFVSPHTLDDDELLLIYGYFNLSATPITLEIQVKPGNVTLPIWNVQPMRMKDEQYIVFPQPIIVEPRSPIAVDASASSTSTAEEAGLLAYLFAPSSVLIAKK